MRVQKIDIRLKHVFFYFIILKKPHPQTLLPPWFILKPPVKTKNKVRRASDPIEPFVCDSEQSPINFRVGGRIVDVMKIALNIHKSGIKWYLYLPVKIDQAKEKQESPGNHVTTFVEEKKN